MVDMNVEQPMIIPIRLSNSSNDDTIGNISNEEKISEETLLITPETSKTISGFSLNLELKIKKLKRSLEAWREIILEVQSVLLWEKQWHPGAVFGASSFAFLIIWMIDPSLLTAVSVLGLIVTVSDYLVPTMSSGFFHSDKWTGAHEKKFEDLCRTLVLYYTHMTTVFGSFYLMRTVRPKVYYTILITSLLLMAWLGSTINNLLLTYFAITWILLLPGLEHKGLVSKYTGGMVTKIQDLLKCNKTE